MQHTKPTLNSSINQPHQQYRSLSSTGLQHPQPTQKSPSPDQESHIHLHHHHTINNNNNNKTMNGATGNNVYTNQDILEKTSARKVDSKMTTSEQSQQEQHYHHHHHHHHHYGSSVSPSSIFPTSSSLRDILAVVFIMLSLPLSISLALLITYIILGSNFMGGKFLINFFLQDNQRVLTNFKSLGVSFMKMLVVDISLFYTLTSIIRKKSYLNYFIILSKAIVSSELIGSSSINYINSISSKKITTKIQYDDKNRIFSNSFINAIFCFIIINYINYLLNWLNVSFKFMENFPTIAYINNFNFHTLSIKIYLLLSIHVINQAIFAKKSAISQNSIPNLSDDISINVDDNKLLNIELNDSLINKFDLWKSINKNNNTIALKNFENFIISPFNSKLKVLKNRLRTSSISNFNLGQQQPQPYVSTPNRRAPAATPATTAATAAATTAATASATGANSPTSVPMKTTTTTTLSTSSATSTSLTTTTISPNATTIENTIIIQPFWSILAAFKAILRNPNLFNGESTRCKNEGGEFNSSSSKTSDLSIVMSAILIDSSKVVLKVLSKAGSMDLDNVEIRLNNVNWSYFKFIEHEEETFLIIYGLTGLFQYEVDMIYNGKLINHIVLSTINSDNDQIINKSLRETSSLTTLQISVGSTMTRLNNLKSKFKKFKREENKKLTELKNSIEIIKNKISKYNDNKQGSDNRVFGKIKGLKHSVIQLESEIASLNQEIESLTNQEDELSQEFVQKESEQLKQVEELEEEYQEYEERIKKSKLELKQIKSEFNSITTKYSKLVNKQNSKTEEIKNLNNDLRNMKKNEILSKFSKRIKKINEKFETILPRVIHETELLKRECDNLLHPSSEEIQQ
ncbi:acrB [[Candida] subhashii]|uniref:AcrB n=1 Tax=[Candida] subhashii TaxID=561895 RepID=A0A8J5QN57_9ASCO|nr:acrB [[Candida] subhashii]KAG7663398.1 acrB [[Candida] subhashii]